MSWAFAKSHSGTKYSRVDKPIIQMQQEAAAVTSLGGGFQLYYKQMRDGSFPTYRFQSMKALRNYVIKRKKWLNEKETIPEVALIYSRKGYEHKLRSVYQPWNGENDAINGVLQGLLDNQLNVDILMDHHIDEMLYNYPVAVLPEWTNIGDELKQKLIDYTKKGGNLIVIGMGATKEFSNEFNLDSNSFFNNSFVATQELPLNLIKQGYTFSNESGIYAYSEVDKRYQFGSVSKKIDYGKGSLSCLGFDLGKLYLKERSATLKGILMKVIENADYSPVCKVVGSHLPLHFILNKEENVHLISVLNVGGEHRSPEVMTFDFIPPLPAFELEIKTNTPPKKVQLQPSNIGLNYKYEEGLLTVKLPSIATHQIIAIDY